MFLLFSGDKYYPSGGWKDFKGKFERLRDAEEAASNNDPDWWQIVSTETMRVISEWLRPMYRR